jgi:hypothetical protein
MKTIVKVHLHQAYKGKFDWYFTTTADIYNVLSENIVGIKYQSLLNVNLHGRQFYANKYCVITTETLY